MMRFGSDRYFRSVGAEWVKEEGSLNNSVSQLVNVRNPLKFIFEENFSLSLVIQKGNTNCPFLDPPRISFSLAHDWPSRLSRCPCSLVLQRKISFFSNYRLIILSPLFFLALRRPKKCQLNSLAFSSPLSRRVWGCGGLAVNFPGNIIRLGRRGRGEGRGHKQRSTPQPTQSYSLKRRVDGFRQQLFAVCKNAKCILFYDARFLKDFFVLRTKFGWRISHPVMKHDESSSPSLFPSLLES